MEGSREGGTDGVVGRRGRTGGREGGGLREGRRVLDTRALHNAQVQAWLCT